MYKPAVWAYKLTNRLDRQTGLNQFKLVCPLNIPIGKNCLKTWSCGKKNQTCKSFKTSWVFSSGPLTRTAFVWTLWLNSVSANSRLTLRCKHKMNTQQRSSWTRAAFTGSRTLLRKMPIWTNSGSPLQRNYFVIWKTLGSIWRLHHWSRSFFALLLCFCYLGTKAA